MAKWGDISRAFNCTESNHTSNKPDTQTDEWDTMAEATRFALDQLIFKGDKLADRIEELEAKLAQQNDLVQAAVAAALREAAKIARASLDGEIAYDDILALITPDARAALDRVVQARFGVVRSEVVRLSAEGKIDSEATERLLAAIRKGGE